MIAGKSISDAANCKPFPPDPNSPLSTISTVVREIRENGGEASAVAVDVRNFAEIEHMVAKTIEVRRSLWLFIGKKPFSRDTSYMAG